MKLVMVKWVDSFERRGWLGVNDWKVDDALHCNTVGWVVGESDACMEVAQTFSDENDNNYVMVHHVISIPKVSISSMHEIPPTAE